MITLTERLMTTSCKSSLATTCHGRRVLRASPDSPIARDRITLRSIVPALRRRASAKPDNNTVVARLWNGARVRRLAAGTRCRAPRCRRPANAGKLRRAGPTLLRGEVAMIVARAANTAVAITAFAVWTCSRYRVDRVTGLRINEAIGVDEGDVRSRRRVIR